MEILGYRKITYTVPIQCGAFMEQLFRRSTQPGLRVYSKTGAFRLESLENPSESALTISQFVVKGVCKPDGDTTQVRVKIRCHVLVDIIIVGTIVIGSLLGVLAILGYESDRKHGLSAMGSLVLFVFNVFFLSAVGNYFRNAGQRAVEKLLPGSQLNG